MQKISALFIASLVTFASTAVNAYDGCKNPTSSYDSTYCIDYANVKPVIAKMI